MNSTTITVQHGSLTLSVPSDFTGSISVMGTEVIFAPTSIVNRIPMPVVPVFFRIDKKVQHHKIAAIKLLRSAFSFGLGDAKRMIERCEQDNHAPLTYGEYAKIDERMSPAEALSLSAALRDCGYQAYC